MRRTLAGIAFFALLGAAPAPPSATRYPTASATDLGATRLVIENDADSAVSGLQVFVAAGLDRESAANDGVAALVAECVVRTPVNGVPLRDAIAAAGGSLSYTVDGRSVHYYLEARSEHLAALVPLFGAALAAPDFSSPTIAASRASLAAREIEFESNPLSVGIAMFRRSYYATGAGQQSLGNSGTLASLSSRDVSAFYRANYRRRATFSSVVGAASPDLSSAINGIASGLADGPIAAVPEKARTIPVTAPRIVARRDVGAPWVVVGFAAPPPASRDFGAMLVLEALLSDAFERQATTTVGFLEKSVGAFYLYDSTPASLVVYVNGSQVDPSLALRELLLVSRSLSQRPLGPSTLAHFKTAARGQFLSDSVNVSDRAYLLGAFSSQGLGADSINAALAALERTNAADVQRVAKTYLQRYIVALVLPRGQ
jgi:predicted Zn-dependent peptidase